MEIGVKTCTVFKDLCQTSEDNGFNFTSVINHFFLLCLKSRHPLAFKSWMSCFYLADVPAANASFYCNQCCLISQ